MKTESIFDSVLESRLDEWAGWHMDLAAGNIGYPRQSAIVPVIEVGIFTSNFGPREPHLHPRAMEINLWIRRMALEFPLYAQALRAYYFNRNLKPWMIARQMEISHSSFKARVHHAKVWLSGCLALSMADIESNEMLLCSQA